MIRSDIMTKKQWLNLLERAAWTFVECFLGSLIFTGPNWKAAVIGAIGAGLSGVKTVILEAANGRLRSLKGKDADGISLNNGKDA